MTAMISKAKHAAKALSQAKVPTGILTRHHRTDTENQQSEESCVTLQATLFKVTAFYTLVADP
ncbi:hypothetical protein ACFQDJ_26580 [Pseudomonas brassicacearum]